MMRSLFLASAPLAAMILLGCSHSAPPPETSTTSTTSAAMTVQRGALFLAPAPRHTVAPLREWAALHPDAAVLLSQWVEAHKQTAVKLGAWAKVHPERMHALVEWAPVHPGATLGAFMANRIDDDLQQIGADDPRGIQDFLAWVRTAPDPADELSMHADGLAYVDRHAAEWQNINTAALTAAQRENATPARGPALGIEQAGTPQIGMRGADTVSSAPPPAKPPEPIPPEDKPATPKPRYPY